ncbi:VOC family protein [Microbacterium sp. X-17]|uniref:VOC family protein n=1 Tax=Microbacterium sp. X-17 TaxID=3144404 RepID=UPI0031F4F24C
MTIMLHEPPWRPDLSTVLTNVGGHRQNQTMEIQLSMVILEVKDMAATLAFYRRLGLNIPETMPTPPAVVHRMGSGVSLLLISSFAAQYDPAWSRPTGEGYQQMLEFYVGIDSAVDEQWATLTGAGYVGRMSPTKTIGPYAAMVEDPDGNVILLTSDEAGSSDRERNN